jgi:Na+/H+ antiporter NhaC
VVLIGGALVLFGLAALDGPIQVALVLCSMVAALIALKNRNSLRAIQHAEQSANSSITAGAVISGAYLGDKLSPLSETTVLTAQLVKVDTYRHIRQQAWTSVPALGIAVAVFVVLGIVGSPQTGAAATASVDLHELGEIYHITPLNLLPLLLLGFLSVKRVPASIALCSPPDQMPERHHRPEGVADGRRGNRAGAREDRQGLVRHAVDDGGRLDGRCRGVLAAGPVR